MRRLLPYILWILCVAACSSEQEVPATNPVPADSISLRRQPDSLRYDHPGATQINTGFTTPEAIVAFARTLKGVPYTYASCSPTSGFDCSGFVFYVFDHFGIPVPRSSADFTNLGQAIDQREAKPGDLILFTGTDSSRKSVGHIGIVISNDADSLQFIHSSSGSAHAVTTSPLKGYYQGRLMKVIRIFKEQ